MSLALQCVLLAVVGAISGFAVHRLSASVRGSLKKQFVIRYFLEGVPITPGIALALFFIRQRGPSSNLFDFASLETALILPYVGVRIAAHRSGASRRMRRENTLPFSHWFDLLRTNPGAAHVFLTTYLAQHDRQYSDPVAELRAACASLEEAYAADPLLPAGVGRLRSEIARLELIRAQVPRSRELP